MNELESLKRKLEEDIRVQSEALSLGRMGSYEGYKETCGLIRGLRYAVTHIDDLLQRYKEYEDD